MPFCAKRNNNEPIIEIGGRNHIFFPLGIETKLIENVLPLRLEDDELHFNKLPAYA